MSLLDALEDSKLMAYALESADLVEKTKKLLKLPAPWTRLTVLGLELCELMGKHQKYDHLLALADSLIPLLQREGQEGQLRTIRVLTYLSYAEPAKIYRLCSMGFPDAFFRTFQRFKQHDAVLMEAYGLRHHTYNADLIQGATSILRTFLLIQDTKCRALNLTAFGVGQVQVSIIGGFAFAARRYLLSSHLLTYTGNHGTASKHLQRCFKSCLAA